MPTTPAVILHVENDSDDVFITQRAFKKAGVPNPIHAVQNGEEAMAYLLGEKQFSNRSEYPLPTVILLDWNMPLMSGSDVLAWLRGQGSLKRIPVVVLTSSSNERDMLAAYELGANGFMVKPRTHDMFQAMALAFSNYWLNWNRNEYGPNSDLL
jgi:CheY-like chemotaxis protein